MPTLASVLTSQKNPTCASFAQVEHPHKLVLMFKDLLKLKENDLMQEAWNLVRALKGASSVLQVLRHTFRASPK